MSSYSNRKILQLLRQSDNGNTYVKGQKFEDLGVYLFEKLNGIRLADRNIRDSTGSQEIDLAFWNGRTSSLDVLDPIFICECKNEANPLGSNKVREFAYKLKSRGASSGILISSSGISGQLGDYRFANSVILEALSTGVKIIVIDRQDILSYHTTDDLLNDISQKYLKLTLERTTS